MSDPYAYWRASVTGAKRQSDELGELMLPTIGSRTSGENPQCGLWKVRPSKGAPYMLMQIWLVDEAEKPAGQWREGLGLRGLVGASYASPDALAERWLFALPVSREDAAYWREHGRWPNDAPPLTGALPPRTHNQPTDPYALILGEARERIEQAKTRLAEPIADQVACDMARNLQAELLALEKRADGMHEVEKWPHLEAGRKVDRRYDFRAALAGWSAKLRTAFGGWLAAEEQRQKAERDRLYAEEVARVEDERARALKEHEQLVDSDPGLDHGTAPELPPLPPAPEPVKMQAGGGVGRKAGLQDDWDFKITEYKLAALHVIDDPGVAIEVGKAIKRRVKAAKGKIDIPGVEIIKGRKAA